MKKRSWLLLLLPGATIVVLWYLTRQIRSYLGVGVNSPDMPAGIRFNNPMNVGYTDGNGNVIGWDGAIGSNPQIGGNPAIFDTPEHGIRAGVKQVRDYNLNTIDGIANEYSGGTPDYATAVAEGSGLTPGEPLDMDDPTTLVAVCKGIVRGENGRGIWYPDSLYAAAVADALS